MGAGCTAHTVLEPSVIPHEVRPQRRRVFIDAYGFKHNLTKHEWRRRRKELQELDEESKELYEAWEAFLTSESEDRDDTVTKKHLAQLCYAGVPIPLRGTIWAQALGVSVKRNNDGGNPAWAKVKQIACEPSSSEKQIQLDLNRTLPFHPFFQTKTGQATLLELLRGFDHCMPEIGYVQGMNLVMAHLLLYADLDEAVAFDLFLGYMTNPGFRMSRLFRPGLKNLLQLTTSLERALAFNCPRATEKLQQLELDAAIWANQYFLTLFAYNFENRVSLALLWDWLFLTTGSETKNGLLQPDEPYACLTSQTTRSELAPEFESKMPSQSTIIRLTTPLEQKNASLDIRDNSSTFDAFGQGEEEGGANTNEGDFGVSRMLPTVDNLISRFAVAYMEHIQDVFCSPKTTFTEAAHLLKTISLRPDQVRDLCVRAETIELRQTRHSISDTILVSPSAHWDNFFDPMDPKQDNGPLITAPQHRPADLTLPDLEPCEGLIPLPSGAPTPLATSPVPTSESGNAYTPCG